LPELLDAVPDRAHTVLEIAIASDEMSVRQRNSAQSRANSLARRHGFEYPSDVGVHPLGSKGSASQKVPATTGPQASDARRRDIQRELHDRTAALLKMLKRALEMYRIDTGTYPSTQHGLEALRNMPSGLSDESKWRGPYLNGGIPEDSWGSRYQYEASGQQAPDGYYLRSKGPDGVDGTADDIGDWPASQRPVESTPRRR
jgi:type II secretion system protein G